ncbi:sensor histidine kinase [Paenibacillus alginolyticus]|uniref:Histidine kinase n=1 Tax=Paenibacillus alginolyticus TaxID=59839 RepID=A0ABT4GAG2_9BACL|nr:histidine kinase [Paenibacillus alginolyticus]MCY9693167.1 histidine kinase [Paenibacillus alginolyticus]MEC0144538.1 histidine kinase [Paenibacillus alginolyticus]
MRPIWPLLNSLRFKFTVAILFVMIPLIVLMWINSRYSVEVVRNQVAGSNTNLLSLYMNQIDSNLADVDNFLFNLSEINTDLLQLEYPKGNNELQYDLARLRLYNGLKGSIEHYKNADVFFIYSETNQDELLVGRVDYGDTFEQRNAIQGEIHKLLRSNLPGVNYAKWHVWKSENGEFYLFHLVKTGSVYVGAWVKADRLMMPLQLMDFGEEGGALLATLNMEPMELGGKVASEGIDLAYPAESFKLTGKKDTFLVMGEPSQRGDFHLIAFIPESAILQKLPYLQRISSVITLGACFFLFLFILYMRKVFLLPIQRIVSAMRKLKEGNWQSYLKHNPSSTEFRIMNDTYNSMIAEIMNLKIYVYEEQLNFQKAEMKHLQMQINPHFFLNSLNIIYNLAVVKDFAIIQEMTKCLVAYFRFMFRNDSYFVTLHDELAHTRNYLRIQQLRFPDYLTYRIVVDEDILSCGIPQLIIQTIVENSIKYAVTLDEVLHIDIHATAVPHPDGTAVLIRIGDSGPGFPEDVLEKLAGDLEAISDDGENVGIWNIKRRLKLLYRSSSSITFGNQPEKGAIVSLLLPAETKGGNSFVSCTAS